jgi:hypothetical protein
MKDKGLTMKKHYIDAKTGISYTLHGGYYLPDLALSQQKKVELNRFGRSRLRYLKEHKRVQYVDLLTSGELRDHLSEIQDEAQARFDEIVGWMKANRDITEELKAHNQMAWVGAMNNIRHCAEEMVLSEIIYR